MIKVLIVEDDEDFVYLVQKLLKKQKDIEVIIGGKDQKKVLEKVHEEHPDIVLMDLNLGVSNMDGILLSREIRIQTDAKVLILTALDTPDMIFKAAEETIANQKGRIVKKLGLENQKELMHVFSMFKE